MENERNQKMRTMKITRVDQDDQNGLAGLNVEVLDENGNVFRSDFIADDESDAYLRGVVRDLLEFVK